MPDARPGAGAIALPGDEARHLSRVLRLGTGARVRVFDGAGHEWDARVVHAARDEARVALDEAVAPAAEPPVRVTLAVALLKGAQMDDVVRDATMLGVVAVAPVESAHVAVAAAGRRSAAATARWRRVAVAAAKQCGRAVVPAIAPVTPLAEALASASARGDALVVCVEPRAGWPAAPAGASAPAALDAPRPAAATVLVGPEGGWTADELDAARRLGARRLDLGPRTLRAEAVPIVALASLWTRWGW